MMQQLLIGEGEIINITNVSLATATYAKFQPQSIDFLDISNPKAVLARCITYALPLTFSRLENTMRKFSCLTEGDIFAIEYNNKVHLHTLSLHIAHTIRNRYTRLVSSKSSPRIITVPSLLSSVTCSSTLPPPLATRSLSAPLLRRRLLRTRFVLLLYLYD